MLELHKKKNSLPPSAEREKIEREIAQMKPIGLISATMEESRIILRHLKKNKGVNLGLPVYDGKIGNINVVHIISGIGKTNASHTATLLIEKFSPSLIINFGIGGAYPSSGLRTGDIAIASKEIYGDEGLWLKDGFHTADFIGIPFLKKGRKRYFNEFMLDKTLVKKAMQVITSYPINPPTPPLLKGGKGGLKMWGLRDVKIKHGTFVTVSTTTGTSKKAKELEKRFSASSVSGGGAICENMEGAAVAHICVMYGIPLLEIRGISNIVEDRDKKRWDIKSAAENCQRIVIEFLRSK